MTREQLDLARRQAFGLDGNALLTLEDAHAWVDRMGLVLFTPKPQLATPAPVFVSAVTGVAEPGLAEIELAKDTYGRLVRDGAVIPLLLMGGAAPGDTPDFLVSPAALPYVYTLRGDKNWKSAPDPQTLSPLALKVWNILKAKGSMTASDLLPELGRELTHSAVLRALAELWSTLRVIPVPRHEEESRWELLPTRFTKQIKAGGNAGLPTALSALISLYMGSVLAAEQDEIEIYLSPLVARSKTRDAVSGLNAARQLEEVVLDGKTLLHVRGELPEMPEIPVAEVEAAAEGEVAGVDVGDVGEAEPDREALLERSKKRVEKTFAEGRGEFERKVPVRTRRPFDPDKKPYVRKPAAEGDRPARRPYDGERKPFRPRTEGEGSERPARRSFGGDRDRKPYDGERRPFRPRTEGDGERPARRSFSGDRERKPFDGERRPFRPRTEGEGGERRPYVRKPFDGERKPFDRDRKPFRKREDGEAGDRPARRSFGGDRDRKPFDGERRPYARKPFDGERKPFDRDRKPFRKREEGEGGERPARRSFGGERDRKPFARKPFDGERKPFRPRTEGEGGERKPFRKPFDGERKPFRPRTEGEGGGDRPARRSFGGDRDRKPFTGERKSYGDRKPSFGGAKKFGGAPKKFGSKPGFGGPKKFGSKPAGGPRKPFKKREDGE